jgi:Zn-dependent proteases
VIQFSLFGIPIQIQPFFWVTMALLGGATRASTSDALLQLGLFVIAGFISILVHELGHALTIKSYRLPTSITLQAFGGYASYPAGRLNRLQNFLVTAAGPALQLVLALVAHVILHRIPPNEGMIMFFRALKWVSILWALLNLLPVLPLDGGHLVNSVLGPRRIKITLWITIVTAVVVGVYGIISHQIFLTVLLGMFAYQAFQALKENNWR